MNFLSGNINGCLWISANATVTFLGYLTLGPPCPVIIECGANVTVDGQLIVNSGASITPRITQLADGVTLVACPLVLTSNGDPPVGANITINPATTPFGQGSCLTLVQQPAPSSALTGLITAVQSTNTCGGSGLPIGAIVGIVLGAIALLAALFCLILYLCRRSRKEQAMVENDAALQPNPFFVRARAPTFTPSMK